jgi:hypothetical protein
MKDINRKEFLKFGAALPLALQSLDLRATSQPKRKEPPKRIVFICNSLGFYEPYFFPKVRGDLASSPYIKEMANHEKMTVFQNLFHPGMDTSNHDSEKSFLTGVPSPEAPNFTNSISLDQVLAREMGGDTRFPFLSFSIYDRGWGCSWDSRGVAIPPMDDEQKIFQKLFGEEDLAAKRRQIENDQHVVQCLYRDMEKLRQGPGHGGKIESYRAVITKLEKQLQHEEFWLKAKKPEVPNTLSDDAEFPFSTKVKNLLELTKLALRTDSTRILTISLDWIYGAIKVPGTTGGWHTLSHHGGKKDALEKLSLIEVDLLKHLNQFLSDLDNIPEGKGTLLDHTTVFIGSNFGNASNHTCNNLPTIIAGGGYKHQAHTVLTKPTPLCNLYLELLHKHNIDASHFGSSEMDMGLLKG